MRAGKAWRAALAGVLLVGLGVAPGWALTPLAQDPHPYLGEAELPRMTPPILQFGDPFLQPGNIDRGFRIPTGAVWQPRFWVFGTLRSAAQAVDGDGAQRRSEWASRLDLFGNLQLTGSERLLVGIQPLHRDGRFTRHVVEPDEDFDSQLNSRVTTLFFEGDFGELFPGLDKSDRRRLDTGFAVGRQPIRFQDGLLIDDTLDAVGLTRDNLRINGWARLSNLRITGLFAWDEVGRADNVEDDKAKLYGLFTAWDAVAGNSVAATWEFDLIFVETADNRDDRVLVGGLARTRRFGFVNNTVRLLASHALGERTVRADNGVLLYTEFSWNPRGGHDLIYVDAFGVHQSFTSAARGPLAGGPLGRTGLLFAARGLGSWPAALSNQSADAAGAAAGYQAFFAHNRRQLVIELGGRRELGESRELAGGLALRFRQALGRRLLVDLDLFALTGDQTEDSQGMRLEFLLKL